MFIITGQIKVDNLDEWASKHPKSIFIWEKKKNSSFIKMSDPQSAPKHLLTLNITIAGKR